MSRRAAIVFAAMLAVAFGVHALIAWWTPTIAGDWSHALWAAHHAGDTGTTWLREFVGEYWRFGSLVNYALVRVPLVHVVLTPAVALALVVGLYRLARGRLPRPSSWDDVLELALLSSFIWMAQPRAGLVWFYRPYAAVELYGAAAATWFLIAWTRARLPVPAQVLAVLGGFLVGTTTPQLAIATTIACIVLVRRARDRQRWMWLALVATAAGTTLGLARPPYMDVAHVLGRSLATNLDLVTMPIREGGELVALIAALALITLLLSKLSEQQKTFEPLDDDRPELARALRLAGIWLGLCALSLFGPYYSEATLLPGTLVLCIAALPFARVIARNRWMRIGVAALALGVHLVVWAMAIDSYRVAGAEYEERVSRLERAAPGSVAVVPPYSQIYPDFWFIGEDWANAADREAIARALYGLRDIDISPPFRGLERNPGIELVFESDAPADAQRAAGVPPEWPRSLLEAQRQFEQVAVALHATAPAAHARLRVTNLSFPELAGRPLLVAWSEGDDLVSDTFSLFGPDYEDRYWVTIPDEFVHRFPEAWSVADSTAQSVKLDAGKLRFQPMTVQRWAAVICDRERCLVGGAFIPRF